MKFCLSSIMNSGFGEFNYINEAHNWTVGLALKVFALKRNSVFWKFPYIELEKWRSAEFYEAEVHRMQLPFSGKVAGMYANVEERQEKRVQQLRRLEEMSIRHREERLQQDQKRLHTLLMVQVNIYAHKLSPVCKWTEMVEALLCSHSATHLFVCSLFI